MTSVDADFDARKNVDALLIAFLSENRVPVDAIVGGNREHLKSALFCRFR